MLPRLWKGVLVLLATFVLSAHCGSAQLLFDPASYLVPSRGALSHTLQVQHFRKPRLRHSFLTF